MPATYGVPAGSGRSFRSTAEDRPVADNNELVPRTVELTHICDECGEFADTAAVDPEARTIECASCGHLAVYELLPPMLFLTGPSGAGKTTVYRHLLSRTPEALLIDHDLLWGANPAHDDPETEYRRFRDLVLAMGMRLAANGTPVVIEGTTVPSQNERLPARCLVSHTAYLALVCDDAVLADRLRQRPKWRGWDEARIETMIEMNRALKSEGASWSPPVELLDTTNRSVEETAYEVRRWIRRETKSWRKASQASRWHDPFTLSAAVEAAADGALEQWVHAYLLGAGRNVPMARGLARQQRWWLGPVQVPVVELARCVGPEPGMPYPRATEDWQPRLDALARSIEQGWDVPPVIVEARSDGLVVCDGNHRYEAQVQLGRRSVRAVIWFNEEASLRGFDKVWADGATREVGRRR